MGSQTSKVYKKLIRNKLMKNKKKAEEKVSLMSINEDGDCLSHATMVKHMTSICADRFGELSNMNSYVEMLSNQLKANVDILLADYQTTLFESRKQLTEYVTNIESVSMNINPAIPRTRLPETFLPIQSNIENSRLLHNLITEKVENCDEYLKSCKDLIDVSVKKLALNNGKMGFSLRKNLYCRIKKDLKKGNIGDCIDVICQLLIATDGLLSKHENSLIMDVYVKKIDQLYEFYTKLRKGADNYKVEDSDRTVANELVNALLEDVRIECSELFDILIKIKETSDDFNDVSNCVLSPCKYFLAVSVSALWLEITPRFHDDYQDIQNNFFEALIQYNYALKKSQGIVNKHIFMPETFEDTVKEIARQYPAVANHKRMNKVLKHDLQLKISF
uniref:BRO1 domain-containing protein n=1 Tax=Rhabditophanes sp. KR3021 TaxID=114890 RepID=A0AC35THC4_9BILA